MKDLNSIYRPINWVHVFGQDSTVSRLRQQVVTGKGLANSYIFAGRSGIGKTTLARLFFKALNCENPSQNGNPCHDCNACKNTTFDLMEVNASDANGVDDVRQLISEVNYASSGKYRGVLLDEAHMLTKAAFNCLLKPMEESAKHVIWFICTTEVSKLPKAIQTRCQVYKVNPLRWTDIKNRLSQIVDDLKIPISDDELWLIARNSDNNLRQAIHILEQYSTTNSLENILTKETQFEFLQELAKPSTNITRNAGLWKLFSTWESRYPDFDSFINAIKYDVVMCLKIQMKLEAEETAKTKLDKYVEYARIINQETLVKALKAIIELQEKVSGVWDYTTLMFLTLFKL